MNTTAKRTAREVRPAADVATNPEGAALTLELPGADSKTISVTVEGEILSVRAERLDPMKDKKVLHRESAPGAYSRSFRLSRDLAKDGIGAEFKNGLLRVSIPRATNAVPKKIEVNLN